MTFSTEHGDLPARGTEMARTSQPPWIPHGAAPFEDRHRVILTVARAAFREKGSGHFACHPQVIPVAIKSMVMVMVIASAFPHS